MKQWFCIYLTILLVCLSGCSSDTVSTPSDFSFSDLDLSKTTVIRLQNAHNGMSSYISDPEDVAAIIAFLQNYSGGDVESAKGYYEGSYALSFYESAEADPIASFALGDENVFYYGDYGDGYPCRYHLKGVTVQEIAAFLFPYDASGLNPAP